MDVYQVLNRFGQEFVDCARQVGIDGQRLLQQLPPSGTLLTGNRVPVLDKKYKNTCSVLFYINHQQNGDSWPFARFHTFKHGGINVDFNGRQLVRGEGSDVLPRTLTVVKPVFCDTSPSLDDQWRSKNFIQQAKAYYQSTAISTLSPWIQKRLKHYANDFFLQRTLIRQSRCQQYIYVPLHQPEKGLVGYHRIDRSQPDVEQKRHFIQESGLLKGAITIIEASDERYKNHIAICEGLATGLSIALYWPGCVYVALTAFNLAAVRQQLVNHSTVCFMADNDQWKPQVGNVGIKSAHAASRTGDVIIYPRFSQDALKTRPTDYNDVLLLQGEEVLSRQVSLAWCELSNRLQNKFAELPSHFRYENG